MNIIIVHDYYCARENYNILYGMRPLIHIISLDTGFFYNKDHLPDWIFKKNHLWKLLSKKTTCTVAVGVPPTAHGGHHLAPLAMAAYCCSDVWIQGGGPSRQTHWRSADVVTIFVGHATTAHSGMLLGVWQGSCLCALVGLATTHNGCRWWLPQPMAVGDTCRVARLPPQCILPFHSTRSTNQGSTCYKYYDAYASHPSIPYIKEQTKSWLFYIIAI